MPTQSPASSYTGRRWYVRSDRDVNRFYIVTALELTGAFVCECPDHLYRARDCKHIKLVQAGKVKPAKPKGAATQALAPEPTPPTLDDLDAWLDDLYGARVAS